MKRTYKNLFSFALAGLLSLSLAFNADAQHGSGGGGSRSSGGGGGGSRPSGGGGGGSRPSGGGGGFSRPSGGGGGSRVEVAPSRPSGGGGAVISRGTQNIAPQRVQGSRPGSNVAIAPQRGGDNRPGSNVATAPQRSGNGVRTYSNGTRYNSVDRRAYNGGRGTYYRGGGYGYGHRTYPGGSYGRYGGRGGYFGSHYYYRNRGYYNSYYLPRLGFSIGFLPYGYYPFWYGDYQYYYSDGLYYQQQNDQYTVVEPPVGAEIKSLPSDAQSIMINGEQYYESNGVYYQSITKDDGSQVYVIAGKDGELNTDQGNGGNGSYDQGPQIGDVVSQLPEDCRKIKINGEKLYVSPDGYYYQENTDNDGNVSYKIVGTPSDEPDNQ